MIRMISNNRRGGILTLLLIILWLIFFFASMFAFFSYKAGYVRIEIGPPGEEIIIVDENTIARLQKKEELLNNREKELGRKAQQFNNIMTQLNIEKQQIEKDQEIISKNLQKITSYFEQFSAEEEKSYKELAKIYEAMKPNRVAVIFDELEIETVAELLKRMKKRASAKILGEIGIQNANRAAEISRIMQGEKKTDAFMNAAQ